MNVPLNYYSICVCSSHISGFKCSVAACEAIFAELVYWLNSRMNAHLFVLVWLLSYWRRKSERERERKSEKGNKWHTKCECVLRFHNQLSMPPSRRRVKQNSISALRVFVHFLSHFYSRPQTHTQWEKENRRENCSVAAKNLLCKSWYTCVHVLYNTLH